MHITVQKHPSTEGLGVPSWEAGEGENCFGRDNSILSLLEAILAHQYRALWN
jgi:hypothetical protein